ncbi:uncharacterized protein BP01DRAFT_363072 [Aspergillus saccharolyticus JOP 1030-1]|uniref:Uncharacterized protein n=1 Tax=Aspergillus saccharolyticus JOP 1030-1 TaxID=1450539 RepID=A0A318ZPY3_9EURO|nr:hypothetical protein BP01DRAFT_363072 [Aspergillus saccharolyticus JOP 1030-1]PYH48604.1 hypothetical protein BP01DRAFT_363072 [Aspergillus saccharolyticus JOP 1030-1]
MTSRVLNYFYGPFLSLYYPHDSAAYRKMLAPLVPFEEMDDELRWVDARAILDEGKSCLKHVDMKALAEEADQRGAQYDAMDLILGHYSQIMSPTSENELPVVNTVNAVRKNCISWVFKLVQLAVNNHLRGRGELRCTNLDDDWWCWYVRGKRHEFTNIALISFKAANMLRFEDFDNLNARHREDEWKTKLATVHKQDYVSHPDVLFNSGIAYIQDMKDFAKALNVKHVAMMDFKYLVTMEIQNVAQSAPQKLPGRAELTWFEEGQPEGDDGQTFVMVLLGLVCRALERQLASSTSHQGLVSSKVTGSFVLAPY